MLADILVLDAECITQIVSW